VFHRFHQYYVGGEIADCSQWKQNYSDCQLWTDNADAEAAARVIDREKERLQQRLKPHYSNDVWEKRQGPPQDWNKELPDYMKNKHKDSYLEMYVRHKNKLEEASSSQLMIMEVQAKAVNATSCTIL